MPTSHRSARHGRTTRHRRDAHAKPAAHLTLLLCFALAAAGQAQEADGPGRPQAVADTPAGSRTATFLCALDLEIALAASSAEQAGRFADVARRAEELRLARLGLSTVVTAAPGVSLGANLLKEEEPAWAPSLELDASLGYRFDEVAIARARLALATAQRRAATQQRTDTLQALVSLSRWRAAERQAAQADATAAEAESLAASVRRSAATAQGATPAGLEPTELDLEGLDLVGLDLAGLDPDLALNVRELDLAAAKARAAADGRAAQAAAERAELARLGVEVDPLEPHDPHAGAQGAGREALTAAGPVGCLLPSAASPPTAPRLPAVDPRVTFERQLLVLAVELAAAQHQRAALAPLRDVNLTARYQEGGARLTAELELAGGRPGAAVALRWRDVNAHNWSVGVSATLRLDDSMGNALAAAQANLDAALTDLAAFDADFPQRFHSETAAAEAAWLDLAFAVEALDIAQARLGLAVGERDVARAEQVVARMVDALEREYQAYVRALARYLAAFDQPWEVLAD